MKTFFSCALFCFNHIWYSLVNFCQTFSHVHQCCFISTRAILYDMVRCNMIFHMSQNSNSQKTPQIARFMGPTWGPSGADRTQVGPMLGPWTLLSGTPYLAPTPQLFVGILEITDVWYTDNTSVSHGIKTTWHGNIFCLTGPLWGESTSHELNPLMKGPLMWSFDVFFDGCLNNRFNKQWSCRWFETLWCFYDVSVMVSVLATSAAK